MEAPQKACTDMPEGALSVKLVEGGPVSIVWKSAEAFFDYQKLHPVSDPPPSSAA